LDVGDFQNLVVPFFSSPLVVRMQALDHFWVGEEIAFDGGLGSVSGLGRLFK
jgi:hypothetical protein